MRFVKQHGIKLLIVVILLIAVYAVLYMKQQKTYQENPGLIPPKENYDIQVDLTTGEIAEFEAEVQKYTDLIENFVPGTGEKIIDFGSGIKGTAEVEKLPDDDWFIQKANALGNLGRYTEAITTINEMFVLYPNSRVGLISLSNIYISLEKYSLAITYLEKLVELYGEGSLDYYRDLIAAYLTIDNAEQAGQRYIKYEQAGGPRDEDLMRKIKSMKAQEK